MLAELGVINAEDDNKDSNAGADDKAGKGGKGAKIGKVVVTKSRSPSAKTPKGGKAAAKGGKGAAKPEETPIECKNKKFINNL